MADSTGDRGLMIVLAYLWPLAVIPLIVSKDEDVRWHARHGLILLALETLLLLALVVVSGIASLTSYLIGCVFSVMLLLVMVAILAVHVVAILKGLGGERLHVPGVAPLMDRF